MGKSLDISECRELLACFDNKWDGLVLIYLVALADDEGWVDCSVYVMAQRLCLHRQTLNRIIQRLCQWGYVVREGEGGKRLRVCYNVGENAATADLTVAEGISRDCLTSDATDTTVPKICGRVDLPNDGESDATASESGRSVDLRNDGASHAADSESDGKVVVTNGASPVVMNNVTSVVTGGVTDLCAQNDTAKGCVSGKYEKGDLQGVTSVVTNDVTSAVSGGVTSVVTGGVSSAVTGSVTDFCTKKGDLNNCESMEYEKRKMQGVTSVVTGGVSSVVTPDVTQKETKENKEEIPPAPPKEEKKQKKEKSQAITHASEKNRHDVKGGRGVTGRGEPGFGGRGVSAT
jgi:predicted transcriptional regulator